MAPDKAKKIILVSIIGMTAIVIAGDAAEGKTPTPKKFLALGFVVFMLIGGAEIAPGLAAAFAMVALTGVALDRLGPITARFNKVLAGGQLPTLGGPPASSTTTTPTVTGTGVGNVLAPTPSSFSGGSIGPPLAGHWTNGGGPGVGTHSGTGSNPHNWESMNAVDLMVPCGTRVLAVADGRIGSQFGPLDSNNPKMAGLRVHLLTSDNEFYYAHLQGFADHIFPGVKVKKGEVLGYSGQAGPCHLHFASKKGNPVSLIGA